MARSPASLLLVGGLVFLTKTYVDVENNPLHLWGIRIFYILSQASVLLTLLYLYVKATYGPVTNPGAMVSVKEGHFGFLPPVPEENSEPKSKKKQFIKVSVNEHDAHECKTHLTRTLLGASVTAFMHFYWGFIPPLVVQGVLTPWGMWSTPLCKVLVRGKRAWGELTRPWTDPAAAMNESVEKWTKTWTDATAAPSSSAASKKKKKK